MHNKEVILVWLPSIGLFGHTYLSGLASQPSPRTKPERRRREGPPQPRATKVPGHQLMGQGDPSARLPFPEGQAALFGDLCSMHTPVPPIPMLWAQVSAPSLGTRKEQKSTRALCWSSPLPAAGVPCWGGSPHPPSDCSFLPHCWASALGRWLTSRGSQSCLIPSSRKQFVARSDGWRVPLKHQETDVWALGFGWHTGLRRPALGEGARQNFIVSGGTTSARDERQHFRSPG